MAEELVFDVDPKGNISFVHEDELALTLMGQGEAIINRASHVEWDRKDGWYVDLAPVGGPRMTGFQTRECALGWEKEWLIQHGLPLPKETIEWLQQSSQTANP